MLTNESLFRTWIGHLENQIMREMKTVHMFRNPQRTNGMTKVAIGISLTYAKGLKVRNSCANNNKEYMVSCWYISNCNIHQDFRSKCVFLLKFLFDFKYHFKTGSLLYQISDIDEFLSSPSVRRSYTNQLKSYKYQCQTWYTETNCENGEFGDN